MTKRIWEPLPSAEAEEIYQEGYQAWRFDLSEDSNPYSGIAAEHWADGYDDAREDNLYIPDR